MCFRPLQGIMHLATMVEVQNKEAVRKFPSPSGDHAFSNSTSTLSNISELAAGFRPLQGIMHLATRRFFMIVFCIRTTDQP